MNGNYRQKNNQYNEGRETLDSILQLGNYLNCGLDKNSLAIIVSMLEKGVTAEQMVEMVKQIKTAPVKQSGSEY